MSTAGWFRSAGLLMRHAALGPDVSGWKVGGLRLAASPFPPKSSNLRCWLVVSIPRLSWCSGFLLGKHGILRCCIFFWGGSHLILTFEFFSVSILPKYVQAPRVDLFTLESLQTTLDLDVDSVTAFLGNFGLRLCAYKICLIIDKYIYRHTFCTPDHLL